MSFPDGLKLDQGLTALDKRKGDFGNDVSSGQKEYKETERS